MAERLNVDDRVRYVGQREKYRIALGTVTRSNRHGLFNVRFDDSGEIGVFSHPSDFVIASAVDRLAALTEERRDA